MFPSNSLNLTNPTYYCFLRIHSMSSTNGILKETAPSVEVKSLSYAFPDGSSGLQNVDLSLPPGSRTLLIGGTSCPTYAILLAGTAFDISQPMAPAKPLCSAFFPANVWHPRAPLA